MRELYHVFLSFSVKLIWKMSPLVLGEILELFLNTLTPVDKYPFQDCQNLPLPIQMQLSIKKKLFRNFLFYFWNVHQNLNILKKRWSLYLMYFPYDRLWKTWLEHSLKNAVSEHAWQSRSKIVPNSCEISMKVPLSCFVIIIREVDLENVSPSVMWNLRGVF